MKAWRKLLDLKEWPLTAFIVLAAVMGNILLLTHYISYNQIRESDAWVDYTQGNISAVLEFSTALQEAIVAQHSYLSLGRADYRELALQKLSALPDKLKPVTSRIKFEQSQNALAEIRYETEALLKMGDTFMKARARGDLARAYDPKMSESFFNLARHIQQNLDAVREQEQALLDDRLHRAKKNQSYYVSMMLAASLSSLIIVVVISWLMLRLRTRQEIVEDELKEARERLSLAIKGTSDGIWDWNTITNDLYLSPRLKEIYGYQPHEMANTRSALHAHIHPDDLPAVLDTTERYLRREIPKLESIFRIRHRDGSMRWIMARGAGIWDQRGHALRVVGVHTDVTSLKHMEEELREAKIRADSANRAKTSFLANMSHEIRTPMNAIIGIAGILGKKIPKEAREREYIDALAIASKTLFALINDLLDLSKLEEGSLVMEQQPFDIREVLEESLTLARLRAEEKHITLDSTIAPNLPQQLIGDSHRLRQILSNLLSNAVKFTEKGGVTLHAGLTPVGHLEIRVRDTGIGIPREAQASIFEKFMQSDPSITRRFGGTGLGLSISRELAGLMGGDIELTSTPGKGSEFIVTLPLPAVSVQSDVETADTLTIAPIDAEHEHGLVLLVEDYKPNVLVARTMLSSYGFGCEVAATGTEAEALLCSNAHDRYVAVLMDVQLPGLSGVDVTKRARAYEATHKLAHLPIIAMTAHALMGDREKFIAAGMDAYVPKPFDPDDLADKLTTLALPIKSKRRAAPKRAKKA